MKPVVRSPLAEVSRVSVFNYETKEMALPPSCSSGVQLPWEEAFLSPVLQAPGYLPPANAGCPESLLTMTLSHRLPRWVGRRGPGETVGSRTGLQVCQHSQLCDAAPIMMSQKGRIAFQGQEYGWTLPILSLTKLGKLKVKQ